MGSLRLPCSLFLKPALGLVLLPLQMRAAVGKSEQTTVSSFHTLDKNLGSLFHSGWGGYAE